jgi:NTP pyrophosphatase (non-canonical NTP hydrolase)
MSFQDAQLEVDSWIEQFEEGYFPPLALMARLTEEVGELARVIMHRHGGKRPKPGEAAGDAGEEIADTIFVLICLANSLGIDLDQAFAAVMAKYRSRDTDRWTKKTPPPTSQK